MTSYVAFLRGIMPMNPNMHGEKLRSFFKSLGFKNVRTVIASGNVLFESPSKDANALENKIEQELPKRLGFPSATFVRSREYLQKLYASDPFKGKQDTPTSRLNVTFKKKGEIFTIINPQSARTPEVMAKLEKENGKQITMRTWKTVAKVLAKFES